MDVKTIQRKIALILDRHHVSRAGLFGSAARDEMRKDSDIDILVRFDRNIGLFEFIGLKLDLEKALGRKVDLVEYDTLKPALKHRVLAEEVRLT
ncbi:nucleotidyltransferase family protein [Candidatus Micrarchaeota archaeon]|nr:nucleotidyltransferase family protein [Candidatus Micrarchaeota archaeon]